MFVSLADLAQITAPPGQSTVWRTAALALSALADKQDWDGLVKATGSLSTTAADAGANSLATAADALKAAVASKVPDAIAKALDALTVAARHEDVASDSDRIMNEGLIGKQIDSLQSDITAFAVAHGGFKAVWDKIQGGPDLGPLKQQAGNLAKQIARAPLTIEGRERLLGRLDQVAAKIQPGDWKLLVGGTVATLALTWLTTKASSVAQASAAAAAAAAHKKFVTHASKTSFGKKLGLKTEEEKKTKKKVKKKTKK